MRNRGAVRLWGLLLVLAVMVVIGIVWGFLLPACVPARASTRRGACLSNVRFIGQAMIIYAGDHDDAFPKSFGALLKEGVVTTKKVFICPSSRDRMPDGLPIPEDFRQADLKELDSVAEWGSYILATGCRSDRPDDWIVVHDKDGAHDGLGRNCAFKDATARWLGEGDFLVRMQRQEAIRRGIEPPKLALPREYFSVPSDGWMSFADRVARWFFVLLAAAGVLWLMVSQKRIVVAVGWREFFVMLLYVATIAGWVWLSGRLETSELRSIVRENRVRLVGFALTRYAWDHDGHYPDSLNALLENGYVTRPTALRGDDNAIRFDLVPGLRHTGDPGCVILRKRDSRGRPKGYFDDGRVESVPDGTR